MNKSVEQLIITLNKEYEIYQEILEVQKDKRRIIIEGKMKELDGITGKEQAMILSIAKLENIREAIMKNIVRELNIDGVENISEIAEYLDSEAKGEIAAIKEKFTEILKVVRNENDLNGRLIEQALEYIEFNKNLLTTLDSTGSTYNPNADQEHVNVKNNLFDAKI